ncbi:SLBB domain-containing protein [Dyadobacter psychrophilus]|uniref:Protein involved in polysaccharide export, contains SLBB domain of the beta-grasp fold n=1 Tax=Dyadobacter psychrophilus TaxID=651661 RepID=A0A1T5FFG5_9BACT|nr:SLBB domain-containing protein [Dyadobacter psychrophilus]SKB94954.1 protein involved in polysaccharide export, contains SLBB domain of the beta-grasp fold [Dyadobacter psychrophilus]
MNRFKLAKSYKSIFLYLLCLSISLPSLSQVIIPQSLPNAPTGSSPQSGNNTGTQRGATGNTGNTQGNQPGANNQQQQSGKQNADSQGNDKGKAPGDQKIPGQEQGKINDSTSAKLNAQDPEKEALRQKIYGYSLFADKNLDPIPDLQIATPTNYIVGPGDELKIFIYNYAESTFEVDVTKDGFISLPRVGNVYVAGRTIEEVRKILIDKFSKFTPGLIGTGGETARTKLMVTLGDVRTVKVFVTGEVINPGTYQVSSLSSAFNALYQAGGPNEIGSFRDVRVVRQGKVVSHIDIYDYLVNGKIDGDIRVQDNDNVVVGYYLKRAEIAGMVKRPGIYELKAEEKLGDMLRYAGGFNDKAYRARLKVQRITSKERKILDVAEANYDAFEVVTGDSVNVETVLDRFENIVTVEGAVMRPGDYSLDNSPSLKQLIENAQGLREDAFVGRVSVLRTRQDLVLESISINYTDVLNNVTPDLILTRLDRVIVPSKFDMAETAYVSVDGEVNNTKIGENEGKFPYTVNMTLEDLLVQAGGLKESAYTSEIEVIRRKRNSIAGAANAQISEVFKFDVDRDLSLNSKGSNFTLMPFDQVTVRKSPNYVEQQSVFVEGEVLIAGPYTIINKNDKISDVIKRAGGLTELAYPEGATLLRRTLVRELDEPTDFDQAEQTEKSIKKGTILGDVPNVKEESIGIKLKNILKSPGSFEDLIVQEGDIIRIPKRLETVQVNGAVLYPTTVKYGKGMAFSDYISQSGGFTVESLRKSSYIKYPNGNVDRTRRFLFFNVYPKVEPGSEIFVPQRAAPALNPQQALQTATGILGSVMSLILAVLAFRSIN